MTSEEFIRIHDWHSAIAAATVIIEATRRQVQAATCAAVVANVENIVDANTAVVIAANVVAYADRGFARCFVKIKDNDYSAAIEDLSNAINLLLRPVMNAHNSIVATTDHQAEYYAKRAYAYWLDSQYERAIADCKRVTGMEEEPLESKGADKSDVKAFAHELLGAVYTNLSYKVEAANELEKAAKEMAEVTTHIMPSFSLLESYRLACKAVRD
jgi:tetratricopeptide (TPR) repeat protein